MINKIKILLYSLFIFIPFITNAETHIYSNDIPQTWDKIGSPYILEEPIYIPKGSSLYIKEGVDIMSASTTNGNDPYSITVEGDLTISGTKDNPVIISDLYSLYFSNSNSIIKNAVFEKTGMDFFKSTSTIESTIIKDSFNAITAKGSNIQISKSNFSNNSFGIVSNMLRKGPVMMFIDHVMADTIFDPLQNNISIHDSVIADNANFGILNQTTNVVDAINNWWGSPDNPTNKVSGMVDVTPWKDKDPNASLCCSNVVFLPGIEASRLYTGNNMLWEPNRNDDVRKLYMNAQGISIDSTIYTKDIIDTALGLKNIYKNFIFSMDSLVKEDKINKWLPIPYDWRKGAYDIVDNKILEQVYDLASTSKTGKIILISHSNGGLVAKTLMKKLEEAGHAGLIEKSIFIAVPELGTPQAILSMLHGYGQSIAGGLILSENNARSFSQNLPGAYGLLPSRKYFENPQPVIISDSYLSNSNLFTYDATKNFLLNNTFSKASSTDINIPLKVNSYLLSLADKFHAVFDNWKSASTTKTLSIIGWGKPTSKGIIYEKDAHCKTKNECDISVFRTVTNSGDGTVLTNADSNTSDNTFFFDLNQLKKDNKGNIEHANILESLELQNFLKDNISEATSSFDYQKYFSTTQPVDNTKWLYIRIYSPVDIHVYDKDGNHTGITDSSYEESIPSSVYDGWGRTKQIILPYDQDYQIVLEGNATGTFSVNTEIMQADKIVASTSFSEMPVTPSMNVDFVVATSTESFSSSTVMYIDSDGDGITETMHNSDQFLKANKKDNKYYKKFKKMIKKLSKKRFIKGRDR